MFFKRSLRTPSRYAKARQIESFRSEIQEMATLSRESRSSLDSGFADEQKSRKSTRRKTAMKKKERKFTKEDISKPLGDLKHMAHIGSSGHSFGDISADISKAVYGSDCFSKGHTLSNAGTHSTDGSMTPTLSLRSEKHQYENPPPPYPEDNFGVFINGATKRVSQEETLNQENTDTNSSMIERCRKSTISFNFELDVESDDILTSVLAVMDRIKNTRINGELNNYAEERIYDEVPPLSVAETRSVTITVERTETSKHMPSPRDEAT